MQRIFFDPFALVDRPVERESAALRRLDRTDAVTLRGSTPYIGAVAPLHRSRIIWSDTPALAPPAAPVISTES